MAPAGLRKGVKLPTLRPEPGRRRAADKALTRR